VLGELDVRFPHGRGEEPTAAAAPDPNDPSAAGAGAGDFSLRALKVTGKSEAAGDYFSGGGTISAMYAGAGANHVQGLKVDAGFEHLQLDAFERLTAGMRKMQREHAGKPAEQGPELQQLWASAGVPLLVNDPAIVVRNFQFASAGGFAMLSGSLRIRGATDGDFRPALNVASLTGKVTADFDIAIDAPLAERLLAPKPAAGAATTRPAGPPPLQALLTQGYLIDDHGRLRSKLHFANGELTLNGKPFTPGRPAAPGPGARH
jgi:uncharacterized protein YdgA (DUF945 family)